MLTLYEKEMAQSISSVDGLPYVDLSCPKCKGDVVGPVLPYSDHKLKCYTCGKLFSLDVTLATDKDGSPLQSQVSALEAKYGLTEEASNA